MLHVLLFCKDEGTEIWIQWGTNTRSREQVLHRLLRHHGVGQCADDTDLLANDGAFLEDAELLDRDIAAAA